ncbi:LysR family transcriptional regulator [Brevibacillus fluminis]|uniref:LysR family transcriptional regulator n=1 Tax=Brevibacillus fluminis TaxID=511487 RepID=A0A3M8DUS8_9BACL|nr:LysR family transcriptional regulator [Brevibacillus fluminis]RNB91269.1 LysR family transcriptional regulator [Brevibacillus fluminis]
MDQQLLVFLTVVEQQNFSRAAEELHMTQPAVSQYIQSLERATGAKLLERSNKYVRLTKAGEIVYHHAKEIVGLYTRMQNLVDDLQHTASGPLSIGASFTYGEYVLPHIIAHLRTNYPMITPTITIHNTKEIAAMVVNHQLDVGIIEGFYNPGNERVVVEAFAEDVMYVVVPAGHRFAGRQEVDAREMCDEAWIVREMGSGTREVSERFFRTLPQMPNNLMEFGSTQIIKESVEAGLGISLLSEWAIRKELLLGTLHMVCVAGVPPVKRHFSLVRQSTPFQTKALEVFLQLLREDEIYPAFRPKAE